MQRPENTPAFVRLAASFHPRTWPLFATTRLASFFSCPVDTVLRSTCHEISRDIAVQQAQQNYRATRLLLPVMILVGLTTAPSAQIADRNAPDPLLDEPQGPCDPHLDRPDYRPGMDVTGNPVPPADLPAARNPAPDGVLIPLEKKGSSAQGRGGPIASLDSKALDPILNPRPACPSKAR